MLKEKSTESYSWKEYEEIFKKIKSSFTSVDVNKDEFRSVLKKRVELLALNKGIEDDLGVKLSFLAFKLGTETYSFESKFVYIISYPKEISDIPVDSNYVAGVFNLKGQIITVLDLKKLLNLVCDNEKKSKPAVIIVEFNNELVGFMVDEIIGIKILPSSSHIKRIPKISMLPEEYLKGIADNSFIILDSYQILNDQRIVVNDLLI